MEDPRIEEEAKEKRQAFRDDLSALCKKHEIKDASFCGTQGDKYITAFGLNLSPGTPSIMESAMSVGRLWQHARSMVKNTLDVFEKNWQ